jgi:hypothetical protein
MLEPVQPGRVALGADVTDRDIDQLAAAPTLKVVQFAKPPPPSVWDRLNERLFRSRPDVQLRVYGFYGEPACDLSFCTRMTNVENFSADCLMTAIHVEKIAAMCRLRSLSIGIFDLPSFEFLERNSIEPNRWGIPESGDF